MKFIALAIILLFSFPSLGIQKISECNSTHYQGASRISDVEVMNLVQKNKILRLSEVYKKAFQCESVDCNKKYTLLFVRLHKKGNHHFYELGVLDEIHSHVYKSCVSADLPAVLETEPEGNSSNH